MVAVFIPPLNTTGEEVANVLAAVGEQSDKPLVSTFLASRGRPGAAARPRRRRQHRRPRLGAVVPRGRGRRARAGPGRGVRRVAAPSREGELVAPDERRHVPARAGWSSRILADAPRPAATSTFDELRELLGGLRHRPVGAHARSTTEDEAVAAGRAARAGTWCSRPPPSTCGSGPTSPTCGATSTPRPRCGDAWQTMQELIDSPATAGFIVQRVAAPGVPVGDRRHGGPAVRAGGVLRRLRRRRPSCSATGPTGSRRCTAATPPTWSARSGPRRCCSATAGSEQVDVDAVEHLLLRVAQLKNDLPQVRSLELNLVLVGADGATVLNAVGRVEPVADARSDWFVRRLSTQAGDTLHG